MHCWICGLTTSLQLCGVWLIQSYQILSSCNNNMSRHNRIWINLLHSLLYNSCVTFVLVMTSFVCKFIWYEKKDKKSMWHFHLYRYSASINDFGKNKSFKVNGKCVKVREITDMWQVHKSLLPLFTKCNVMSKQV